MLIHPTRLRPTRPLMCVTVLLAASALPIIVAADENEGIQIAPPEPHPVPVLLVERPIHDFGTIWAGNATHAFVVKNVGQANLMIEELKPSCGCTTASKYPRVIKPGEQGEFPFRVDTKRYHGPFTITATLTTNDPAHRVTKLTFRGHVKHRVTVKPRGVYFGYVKKDQVTTRKVRIEKAADEDIDPKLLNPPSERIPFKIEMKEIEKGKLYELEISTKPPFPSKSNRYVAQIDPGIENASKINITCTAVLPDRLNLSPEAITLATTQHKVPRALRFTNHGDKPVKLLDIKPLDDRLTATKITRKDGWEYLINVHIPDGYVPPDAGTTIILKTDDEEKPELRIPVRATLALRRQANPRAREKKPPPPGHKLVGKPAPTQQVKLTDHKSVKIGQGADVNQLIVFYASWCGACKVALPEIEKLYQRYDDKGLDFVLVNVDRRTGKIGRTPKQTMEHYQALKLTMPMTMDSEQEHRTAYHYKATVLPSTYLINKSGKVEAYYPGRSDLAAGKMEEDIKKLLAGKKVAADQHADAQPSK